MKKILLFVLFASWMITGYCAGDKKPSELRILYLAGNSDWNPDARGMLAEGVIEKGLELRKQAFGDLLRKYFSEVTVIEATDYSPEMSDEYDVTIFDGLPPVLEQRQMQRDASGQIIKLLPARYLPDDFSAPCITIGSVSSQIGAILGVKHDWFCLCLDAYAHHLETEHPIFHGPFKTELTFEQLPTPDEAFYYQALYDKPIPEILPMWRVQTKGYKTEIGFGVGLVSRPWGYTDSPDCEYISSGVCAKSPDAVAIGRHGNFLMWGFIASPRYMTEEAKVVFVNAVAYISRFKDAPLVRKYNENIPTRISAREMKYNSSRVSYNDQIKFLNSMKKMQEDAYVQLKERKAKGEKLHPQEEAFFENYKPMEVSLPPFSEHMKQHTDPELYAQFGDDEAKYAHYYDSNTPYFYGGGGGRRLVLDEDAKAWQIATNDKRLLDKAITCLENGVETERAWRVLTRYTLCDFATPAEWRKWYDRYKEKMFFTESGGWFFMINGSRNTPGNDYSVLERRKNRQVQETIARETDAEVVAELSADNPVIISAKGKMKDKNLAEVSILIKLYSGFHVYRRVSESDPYTPMKVEFQLPEGCSLDGDMNMPAAIPFGKTGTTMYEGNVILTQCIRCNKLPESIRFTFSYQCCDSHVCLPPQEKEFEVKIK